MSTLSYCYGGDKGGVKRCKKGVPLGGVCNKWDVCVLSVCTATQDGEVGTCVERAQAAGVEGVEIGDDSSPEANKWNAIAEAMSSGRPSGKVPPAKGRPGKGQGPK